MLPAIARPPHAAALESGLYDGLSRYSAMPYNSPGDNQFSGHKNDPESDFHYNLARPYNEDYGKMDLIRCPDHKLL